MRSKTGNKKKPMKKRIEGFFCSLSRNWEKSFFSKAILVDTPTHSNLGDHGIVLAEKQFVQSNGIKRVAEITAAEYDKYSKWLAKYTPKSRIILVPGGGFLGCL